MSTKILLTSFDTWLSHQLSNASDDLLIQLQKKTLLEQNWHFVRQLPVEIPRASERVIKAIEQLNPELIICCGMAERRYHLTLESNARGNNQKIFTTVNLSQLVNQLSYTSISHDAGQFVCEGLYYQVLSHLQNTSSTRQVLFIHVPIFTSTNFSKIMLDVRQIIDNDFSKV
ncbi:peptidase C15 [Chroococcus sp. FPU101]|uniref:pyroglutamyl-peptidase I family protein n=1 Tax=Chroococcus sp. FPU101 TaxID=1974212 RepID=UPI001A8D5A84|nr:peptidase C15 [Chroococcus sp. FPU101]GFE69807.1 peptidase C15 pyroglutamyl peptidase I [Chroococcus sp. FPU101]